MEAPELRAGLDADRLHERRPGLPVGRQGVGLATGTVERQHPLGLELLAQGLLEHQRLELPEDLAVAAQVEILLDGELRGCQAQLLQPADLSGGERLGGDVDERRSAPEGERLARPSTGHEPLEALRVEVVGAERELVPPPAGDDVVAVPGLRERLAQRGDVELDELHRRRRRPLAPQPVDDAPRGNPRA